MTRVKLQAAAAPRLRRLARPRLTARGRVLRAVHGGLRPGLRLGRRRHRRRALGERDLNLPARDRRASQRRPEQISVLVDGVPGDRGEDDSDGTSLAELGDQRRGSGALNVVTATIEMRSRTTGRGFVPNSHHCQLFCVADEIGLLSLAFFLG